MQRFTAFFISNWHVVVPALIAVVIYLPTLRYEFVWDDGYFIDWKEVQEPIKYTSQLWAGSTPMSEGLVYRPIRSFAYAAMANVFTKDPSIYHGFAIGIHMLIVISTSVLALQLYKSTKTSLVSGLIMAVHPLHLENIAWITTAFDVLGIAFMMGGMMAYFHNQNTVKAPHLSIFLFTLAALTYELTLTTPIALAVYAKAKHKKYAHLLIPSVVYLVARGYLGQPASHAYVLENYFDKIVFAFMVIGKYLTLSVVPFKLSLNHTLAGITNFHFLDGMTTLPIIPDSSNGFPYILVSLVALSTIWYSYRQKKFRFSFLLFWSVVSVIPVANIIPIHTIFAEKYAFIMTIPISILLARFCMLLASHTKNHYIYTGIYIVILSLLTITRMPIWQNTLTLWQQGVLESPPSAAVYQNLAASEFLYGRNQAAITNFTRSLTLMPSVATHIKLGYANSSIGDYLNAIAQYEQALKLAPLDLNTLTLLADAYYQSSHHVQAKNVYQYIVTLDPSDQYAQTKLNEITSTEK